MTLIMHSVQKSTLFSTLTNSVSSEKIVVCDTDGM